jgi:hypothetical protein
LAVGFVDELLVIANWPVNEPELVGANWTLRFSVWPGFRVTGKLDPETEKPVPDTAAEFTVTAVVPLEVNVTVCVACEPTTTLPNEMLVALTVRVGAAGVRFSAKFFDAPPAVAVSVTVWAVLKEATVAAKEALVAPAATVTEPGTVTVLLLLERPTLTPPDGAAPVRVGVQVTLPAPVIVELLHVNVLRDGDGDVDGFNWIA